MFEYISSHTTALKRTEFLSDQDKMFLKLSKLDPAHAVRLAFDTILEMNNAPHKFHTLLDALEEAGLFIALEYTLQDKNI